MTDWQTKEEATTFGRIARGNGCSGVMRTPVVESVVSGQWWGLGASPLTVSEGGTPTISPARSQGQEPEDYF